MCYKYWFIFHQKNPCKQKKTKTYVTLCPIETAIPILSVLRSRPKRNKKQLYIPNLLPPIPAAPAATTSKSTGKSKARALQAPWTSGQPGLERCAAPERTCPPRSTRPALRSCWSSTRGLKRIMLLGSWAPSASLIDVSCFVLWCCTYTERKTGGNLKALFHNTFANMGSYRHRETITFRYKYGAVIDRTSIKWVYRRP